MPTAGAGSPPDGGPGGGGSIGLGFAIPVDLCQVDPEELIAHGSRSPTRTSAVGRCRCRRPQRPRQAAGRAVRGGRAPGGPAQPAGLQVGDVITKLDDQTATSTLLESLTLTKKPGDTVSVTYFRDGKAADATITLGSAG